MPLSTGVKQNNHFFGSSCMKDKMMMNVPSFAQFKILLILDFSTIFAHHVMHRLCVIFLGLLIMFIIISYVSCATLYLPSSCYLSNRCLDLSMVGEAYQDFLLQHIFCLLSSSIFYFLLTPHNYLPSMLVFEIS